MKGLCQGNWFVFLSMTALGQLFHVPCHNQARSFRGFRGFPASKSFGRSHAALPVPLVEMGADLGSKGGFGSSKRSSVSRQGTYLQALLVQRTLSPARVS